LGAPSPQASTGEQAEVYDPKKAQLLHRKEQAAARKAKKQAKEAAELQRRNAEMHDLQQTVVTTQKKQQGFN
jgi:hypothetical protein